MHTITFAQAVTIFIEIGFLIQKSAYCNRKNKLSYLGHNVIKYKSKPRVKHMQNMYYICIYKYMHIHTYIYIYIYMYNIYIIYIIRKNLVISELVFSKLLGLIFLILLRRVNLLSK